MGGRGGGEYPYSRSSQSLCTKESGSFRLTGIAIRVRSLPMHDFSSDHSDSDAYTRSVQIHANQHQKEKKKKKKKGKGKKETIAACKHTDRSSGHCCNSAMLN